MLIREWNKDRRSRDLEDVLRAAAHDTDVEDVIYKGEPVINSKFRLSFIHTFKPYFNVSICMFLYL